MAGPGHGNHLARGEGGQGDGGDVGGGDTALALVQATLHPELVYPADNLKSLQ